MFYVERRIKKNSILCIRETTFCCILAYFFNVLNIKAYFEKTNLETIDLLDNECVQSSEEGRPQEHIQDLLLQLLQVQDKETALRSSSWTEVKW